MSFGTKQRQIHAPRRGRSRYTYHVGPLGRLPDTRSFVDVDGLAKKQILKRNFSRKISECDFWFFLVYSLAQNFQFLEIANVHLLHICMFVDVFRKLKVVCMWTDHEKQKIAFRLFARKNSF